MRIGWNANGNRGYSAQGNTSHFRFLIPYSIFIILCTPLAASAYGQATYYSQSYYQGYYQTYYQSSYQTTINPNTTASSTFAVTGAVSKSSGSFVIDHPLDPKNKLLFHSFVESPDAKNIYDGIAVLDKNGESTVRLPAYFDALNTDVRYQLKPIGAPMPNLHVKEEEKDNRFVIGGGTSGGKVSWQIAGTRKDAYILANPIIPEVEKGPNELVDKGEFIFPEGYGASGLLSSIFFGPGDFLRSLFGR